MNSVQYEQARVSVCNERSSLTIICCYSVCVREGEKEKSIIELYENK